MRRLIDLEVTHHGVTALEASTEGVLCIAQQRGFPPVWTLVENGHAIGSIRTYRRGFKLCFGGVNEYHRDMNVALKRAQEVYRGTD